MTGTYTGQFVMSGFLDLKVGADGTNGTHGTIDTYGIGINAIDAMGGAIDNSTSGTGTSRGGGYREA